MTYRTIGRLSSIVAFVVLVTVASSSAAEYFVKPGALGGNGSAATPFGTIAAALQVAQAGDVVTLTPGTYRERVATVRGGTAASPITIRGAQGAAATFVTVPGETMRVLHPYVVVAGVTFDAQYADADAIRITSAATGFILRDSEVRRATRDCIDISAPAGVVIERAKVHHCLNAAGGRTDAHGIVAGAVAGLTIRDTEIHTFSGDGVQVDPGRSAPGWSGVTIERCLIWLAPLPAPENGFPAGAVTGENAVDTKASSAYPRATIVVRDTVARGFRTGLVSNMAAFNLKESIAAQIDRVTVSESEIAFRLRGGGSVLTAGAQVRLQNVVIHDVVTAMRYEDNLRDFKAYHVTVGMGVTRAFQAASSDRVGLDVRNSLFVAAALPVEAPASTNRAVSSAVFVNAANDDYHLLGGAQPIDSVTPLSGVPTDRDGAPRPVNGAADQGAYEWQALPAATVDEIVAYTGPATLSGRWLRINDTTAAGGTAIATADVGSSGKAALAAPADYADVTFTAQAGVPYRVWIRGRAAQNRVTSDSAFVQFTNSLDLSGLPLARIGTTQSLLYVLEDCTSCGVSGWGWNDVTQNGAYATVTFATSGTQRLRLQVREDGLVIDQIVLSAVRYLSAAPGTTKNDTTILAKQP